MNNTKRKPRYAEWTFENSEALQKYLRKTKLDRRHTGWVNEVRRRKAS
jgi:ribosomal protein L24E